MFMTGREFLPAMKCSLLRWFYCGRRSGFCVIRVCSPCIRRGRFLLLLYLGQISYCDVWIINHMVLNLAVHSTRARALNMHICICCHCNSNIDINFVSNGVKFFSNLSEWNCCLFFSIELDKLASILLFLCNMKLSIYRNVTSKRFICVIICWCI